jgi:hypothetical protein
MWFQFVFFNRVVQSILKGGGGEDRHWPFFRRAKIPVDPVAITGNDAISDKIFSDSITYYVVRMPMSVVHTFHPEAHSDFNHRNRWKIPKYTFHTLFLAAFYVHSA